MIVSFPTPTVLGMAAKSCRPPESQSVECGIQHVNDCLNDPVWATEASAYSKEEHDASQKQSKLASGSPRVGKDTPSMRKACQNHARCSRQDKKLAGYPAWEPWFSSSHRDPTRGSLHRPLDSELRRGPPPILWSQRPSIRCRPAGPL